MKKTFLRKLIKFSHYSTCLTLPKSATEELGWDAGSELEVKLDAKHNRLVVTTPDEKPKNGSKLLEPVTFSIENEKKSKPLVTKGETEKINKEEDDLLPLEEL